MATQADYDASRERQSTKQDALSAASGDVSAPATSIAGRLPPPPLSQGGPLPMATQADYDASRERQSTKQDALSAASGDVSAPATSIAGRLPPPPSSQGGPLPMATQADYDASERASERFTSVSADMAGQLADMRILVAELQAARRERPGQPGPDASDGAKRLHEAKIAAWEERMRSAKQQIAWKLAATETQLAALDDEMEKLLSEQRADLDQAELKGKASKGGDALWAEIARMNRRVAEMVGLLRTSGAPAEVIDQLVRQNQLQHLQETQALIAYLIARQQEQAKDILSNLRAMQSQPPSDSGSYGNGIRRVQGLGDLSASAASATGELPLDPSVWLSARGGIPTPTSTAAPSAPPSSPPP
jgi:hypothetical protein